MEKTIVPVGLKERVKPIGNREENGLTGPILNVIIQFIPPSPVGTE